MTFLSIEAYDANECQARVQSSYPAIRAFSPVAFHQVNFPTRVTDERELRRYSDIMYELLPRRRFFQESLYNRREIEAVVQVVKQIRSVTQDIFGDCVEPAMCLFPPIPILRAVDLISRVRKRKLKIFEVGPGSGYLGAYLLNAGHPYTAMDNCQALYLWQNRLFSRIAETFLEFAIYKKINGFERIFGCHCTHIPWWQFAAFHETGFPLGDVVICDAAMGEMDTFGLRYLLHSAKAIAAESDCGAFIFQNLGEERVHHRADVESLLDQLGFAQHKIGGVSIFSLNDRLVDVFPADMTELPHLGAVSSLDEPTLPLSAFLAEKQGRNLESYAFFKFVGLTLDSPD